MTGLLTYLRSAYADDIERRTDYDYDLDPMRRTAAAAGHPQTTFDTIHVVGTNGKGTTTEFIATTLREAGYTVGVYSDPIVTDTPRFTINDAHLSRDAVDRIAPTILNALDDSFTPSDFELLMAVGLDWFADHSIDIAVMEGELGGRYDATNIVNSDVTVITSVGRDHIGDLGENVDEIAHRIAGAIDRNTTAVSNVDGPPADIIAAEADANNATLITDWTRLPATRNDVTYTVEYGGQSTETQLIADYQLENVSTAITTLTHAPVDVSTDAIHTALAKFTYPGRMELAAREPLTLFDGAHNPSGIEALLETLMDLRRNSDQDRDVYAVFGAIDRVAAGPMVRQLGQTVDTLFVTDFEPNRATKTAADPTTLGAVVRELDAAPSVSIYESPQSAVNDAVSAAASDDIVLVTGSLYLVEQVRALV